MKKNLKNKTLNLPSTFITSNISKKHFFDLNGLFWDYFFSKENISKIFNDYLLKVEVSDEEKIYFDFILDNLEKIKVIAEDTYIYPHLERNTLFYFKIYYLILSIVNSLYDDYLFILPYGVYLKDKITNIEKYLADESNLINIFFNKILENPFFEDNINYIFMIHWENELHLLMGLSKKLRKKFKNIKITVNLKSANEQLDFSYWTKSDFIKQYIDEFINVYYEDTLPTADKKKNEKVSTLKINTDTVYNINRLAARLFPTKCYWHKCSFCVINSQYKSEKIFGSLTDEAKAVVDEVIASISMQKDFFLLYFYDEAIEISILLYFAKEIIRNKIKVFWSVRTRFTKEFNEENCRILGQSGLRFLGFGLESANKRINKFVNKRDDDLTKDDLNKIIETCDKNNINVHTYFIIGFPSETKEETDETLEFVEYNLKKRRFYTYSANIFFLQKGSEMYNNPDKFGIKIIDDNDNTKLGNFTFEDNNPGEKYSRDELKDLSHKIYSKMFFKNVNDDYTAEIGYNFWDLIDRLGTFYFHKLINDKNPYWNDNIEKKQNNDEILNLKFKMLPLIKFKDSSKYMNFLDEEIISISNDLINIFSEFIKVFNSELSLIENINESIKNFNLSASEKTEIILKMKELIFKLINLNVFYQISVEIKNIQKNYQTVIANSTIKN